MLCDTCDNGVYCLMQCDMYTWMGWRFFDSIVNGRDRRCGYCTGSGSLHATPAATMGKIAVNKMTISTTHQDNKKHKNPVVSSDLVWAVELIYLGSSSLEFAECALLQGKRGIPSDMARKGANPILMCDMTFICMCVVLVYCCCCCCCCNFGVLVKP